MVTKTEPEDFVFSNSLFNSVKNLSASTLMAINRCRPSDGGDKIPTGRGQFNDAGMLVSLKSDWSILTFG